MTQHTPLSSDNHTHDHDAHDTHPHTDHTDHNHHDHSGAHGHTHGIIDPGLATTERGIWAIEEYHQISEHTHEGLPVHAHP